jgi:hypothetical protein
VAGFMAGLCPKDGRKAINRMAATGIHCLIFIPVKNDDVLDLQYRIYMICLLIFYGPGRIIWLCCVEWVTLVVPPCQHQCISIRIEPMAASRKGFN